MKDIFISVEGPPQNSPRVRKLHRFVRKAEKYQLRSADQCLAKHERTRVTPETWCLRQTTPSNAAAGSRKGQYTTINLFGENLKIYCAFLPSRSNSYLECSLKRRQFLQVNIAKGLKRQGGYRCPNSVMGDIGCPVLLTPCPWAPLRSWEIRGE